MSRKKEMNSIYETVQQNEIDNTLSEPSQMNLHNPYGICKTTLKKESMCK